MNAWKAMVGALLVANLVLLGWGLLGSGASLKQVESGGLRSEWVTVERPWQQAVEVVRSNAPVAPKINLKEGLAQLDSAIQTASKQVFDDPKNSQACLQWGPLLQSESARVADSLANWGGVTDRQEKQVPVGYVVFLPKDIVNSGVGIEQLSGKGITDMFYITTPGPLQGTISLGLFRDVERANIQKDELIKRGVSGIQIRERLGPVRVFFELKGTPDQIKSVQSIFELNSKGELKTCGS